LTKPLAWIGATLVGLASAHGQAPLDLREVCNLIRSNLPGVSEAELNQAALEGILARLQGQAILLTNAVGTPETTATNQTPPAKTNLFDRRFGYLRVAVVTAGTAEAFAAALDQLTASNRLRGLVLDLRFATGTDYAEAGRIADRFVASEGLLFQWGDHTARATAKTNAFREPLAVLVNARTSGAPEALAGALRQANAGLLVGNHTAGRASVFKEYALSNGHRLLLASDRVQLGDQHQIPPSGLAPDITVEVAPEQERLYLADPYRAQPRSGVTRLRGPTSTSNATNHPARITEADLVRMRREGLSLDDADLAPPPLRSPAPIAPVVTDPALARALDLLKGLAVVRSDRAPTPRGPQ
jgi:hypothetical protein